MRKILSEPLWNVLSKYFIKSFERVFLALLYRVTVIYKYSWCQEQSRNWYTARPLAMYGDEYMYERIYEFAEFAV
jgi:hypothetical protein